MAAATPSTHLVGGIDPHADTIHVAVVTAVGKPVRDAEFRTDPDGYQAAIAFLTSSGTIERVGVEGAADYGAGITRALVAAELAVVEVERHTRSDRRRAGKSDQMDARVPSWKAASRRVMFLVVRAERRSSKTANRQSRTSSR